MNVLKQEFYERNTVKVSKELLGKILIHQKGNKILAGKIVEKGYNYGTVADEAGVDRNTISSAIDGNVYSLPG